MTWDLVGSLDLPPESEADERTYTFGSAPTVLPVGGPVPESLSASDWALMGTYLLGEYVGEGR